MPSMIKTITDDIVTILTGASLSQTLAIDTVTLDPDVVLKRMTAAEYKIQVVPLGIKSSMGSRSASLREYTIGVGIFKKLADSTLVTAEPALLLTEEILDLLDVDQIAEASFTEIDNVPVYSVDDLNNGLFFSVVNVTYTARR